MLYQQWPAFTQEMQLLLLVLFVGVYARRHHDDDYSPADKLSESFQGAVPFGEQYRDGIPRGKNLDHSDPQRELSEVPKTRQRNKFFNINDDPKAFANPRDAYLYKSKQAANVSDDDVPLIFNFAKLLENSIRSENLKLNEIKYATPRRKPRPDATNTIKIAKKKLIDDENKKIGEYFQGHSFDLRFDVNEDRILEKNWTTCDEFGKHSNFHPDDIVDLDWVPFYIWSEIIAYGYIHRFEIPTIKEVQMYRQVYGPHIINFTVNWEEPKLIMRSFYNMLLIALDRKGLFLGIPRHEMPDSIRGKPVPIHILKVRLKIVDPYLAMMYCDEQEPLTQLMAVSGQEPSTFEEKIKEAKILKFVGSGQPVERDLEYESKLKKGMIEDERYKEQNKYIDVVNGMFPQTEMDALQKAKTDQEIAMQRVRFYYK